MLGREAVLDRGDEGGDPAGEAAAEGVVWAAGGGVEGEAAAVEVDDEREGTGGGGSGGEEAEPEVAGWVDGVVGSGDAVGGAGVGRGPAVEEVKEPAVDGAVAAAGSVGGGGDGGDDEAGLQGERGTGRGHFGIALLNGSRHRTLSPSAAASRGCGNEGHPTETDVHKDVIVSRDTHFCGQRMRPSPK